jgi:two-component system, OmpR family, sensor kinase
MHPGLAAGLMANVAYAQRAEPDAPGGMLSPTQPARPPTPPSTLTPRQREIAALVAGGMSNSAIAEQLVLTTGTVANHIASILQRLNLQSRTQIATWAVEHGLHGGQDWLLTTLERLLDEQPASVSEAMTRLADVVVQALGADKVDVFLHDPVSAMLIAVGTSTTPVGERQRALGLDRLLLARGGRAVEVFRHGQPHLQRDVRDDDVELVGIRRDLRVRSQLMVPLEVGRERRGVLGAQSMLPDFFANRDLLFLRAASRWVAAIIQRFEATPQAGIGHAGAERSCADQFLAVVAHDLCNQLAPMRGRVDLLLNRAQECHELATVHEAQQLRRAVDRLAHVADDVLDFGRLQQGLSHLLPEPLDLVELVTETARALHDVTISVEAPQPVRVVADRLRLRHAIESLVAGAVEHAAAASQVQVLVAYADVPWPAATVTVTDEGASASLSLGVYLARAIACAHGGTVETCTAESGRRIRLALPAAPLRID